MKAIYKHIAFAALALSAVACSQDDDFAPSYLSDPDAVRITAQVGTADVTGGFTRSNPLGTAEEQAKFNSGDQISVTAGTQAPVTYQLSTDGWKPVGEAYLKWQTNEMNVTAYYPVGKNDASATTFTVPTEYTDLAAIAEADYMTYSGTQTKGDDKSINLAMQRKMVRLVITPEFNDQFATGCSVTTIKVNANTKGYADEQPETGNITVTALKQGDTFYALLAPTTADADVTFLIVTVSDGTTSQDLTVKGIPATTAGNSYSFALTVGKDKVAMGTVSVKDWTGATIEGGEATEVKVTTVIEGNTATITIPDVATDAMVQKAISNLSADITTITANGNLSDAMHAAIISAISKKNTQGAVTNGKLSESSVTYTVHSDFTEALTAWTGADGATLTLLADTPECTANIKIEGKTLTLDLNGHTLNCSNQFIQVEENEADGNTEGGLTICDSGTGGAVNMTQLTIFAGIVNLQGGTLNNTVNNWDRFNMIGGKVISSSAQAISNGGTVNISGGELSGRYGIFAGQESVVNISGSPVITGADLNANNKGAAIAVYNDATVIISGTPTLTGGSYGEIAAYYPVTLNTQPTTGTWRIYTTEKMITNNNGVHVFANPGEGIELDASKFESLVDGYKVQKQDDGSLALVQVATEGE